MRKFRVTVNGEVFEVNVEEIGGTPGNLAVTAPVTAARPAAAVTPVTAPAPAPVTRPAPAPVKAAPAPVPAPSPRKQPTAGGETVSAPLPGTISDIKVSAGQQVEAGQVVMILEAMKMENEVTAPVSGQIAEILVNKGQSVTAGDPLLVIG
ncbi:hypothetical protein SY88_03180 [Clostridiales bacterium PH28_bin88]|nr:hypothetical protein SY88_03180 [Clostridiales bacterium PH28_bin88]